MRKVCVVLTVILGLASMSTLSAGAGAIRISQVYPGGGHDYGVTPQAYRTDYVELFNASGTPVDVGGWILAYGGPTPTPNYGCAGCTGVIPPATILAPCGYLLIKVGDTNPVGAAPDVPAPDLELDTPKLSYVVGSLGLFSAGVPTGVCPTFARVDAVAWRSICNENHSTPGPDSLTQALVRLGEGMVDTDNNQADFTIVSGPVPRNSGSPQNQTCLQTPARESTWGRIKANRR